MPEIANPVAGDKMSTTIVAEHSSKEGVAFTRWILKLGLETLALKDPVDVRDSRLDPARQFCRMPRRGASWWYAIDIDIERMKSFWSSGVSVEEFKTGVRVEVFITEGCEFASVEFLGVTGLVPLTPRAEFSGTDIRQPTFQVKRVRV